MRRKFDPFKFKNSIFFFENHFYLLSATQPNSNEHITRPVEGYPVQSLPAGRPLPQIPGNLPVSHSQESQLTSNPSNKTYIGYGQNLFKKSRSNWIFLNFCKEI